MQNCRLKKILTDFPATFGTVCTEGPRKRRSAVAGFIQSTIDEQTLCCCNRRPGC